MTRNALIILRFLQYSSTDNAKQNNYIITRIKLGIDIFSKKIDEWTLSTKEYSISLIIRVKQIKIIMKYQYSLGWQTFMEER